MNRQVLSIKQMQHLKELGLDTSKASMCWLKDLTKELAKGEAIDMSKGWFLDFHEPSFYKYGWLAVIPTFTLQDILDLLPKEIDAGFTHKWYLYVNYQKKRNIVFL